MQCMTSHPKMRIERKRREYIQEQVLKAYKMLPEIVFPMDARQVFDLMPNCSCYSYQEFALKNRLTIDDVITFCSSKFGCTAYNRNTDRYLVLYNDFVDQNNNYGRQRWTCSHELGHILCGHHFGAAENHEAFEREADLFASLFLAPFPLFETLNVKSPIDVQDILGLSCEASVYTIDKYIHWRGHQTHTRRKDDFVKVYSCQKH